MKVLISAGERSGEMHALGLIKELRKIMPSLEILGIGGELFEQAGIRLIGKLNRKEIIGVDGIAKNISFFYKLTRKIEAYSRSIEFAILTDYPGYHLFVLARVLSKKGIPVIYFIPPQVWAWHRFRVKLLKRYVRKVLAILPFEEEFFKRFGIEAKFVGNPVKDEIQQFLKDAGDITPDKFSIGLLPGSREGEILRHLPVIEEIGRSLKKRFPQLKLFLSLDEKYMELLKSPELFDRIVKDGREIMLSSEVIVAASGTATLEAAILKKPMVVIYKTSPITYFLARSFLNIPYISLPNIILGKRVVKEFIQSFKTNEIIDEIIKLFQDNAYRQEMIEAFEKLNRILKGNAYETAAQEVKKEVLQNVGVYKKNARAI